MKHLTWLAAAALLLAASRPVAAATAQDAQFVNTVLGFGVQEYDTAAIEADSGSRNTGDYAQRVMSDYGTFNTQLVALASKFHVHLLRPPMPTTAASPVPQAADALTKERQLRAPNFHPARYLNDEVLRQRRLLVVLIHEERYGDNQALRLFAHGMIPMVQSELVLATHTRRETGTK